MQARTIKVAPIRKSLVVKTSADKAFIVFTAKIGRWWPRAFTIGTSPIKDVVMEERSGGRWYERGDDGSECAWGKVLAWEPPTRVVLAWQILPVPPHLSAAEAASLPLTLLTAWHMLVVRARLQRGEMVLV